MNCHARQRDSIVVAAFVVLGLLHSATAQFTYVTNNGAITITGYAASNGPSVTIPGVLSGYPVTAIGNAAFGGDDSLTSVTIPNSVTNIGAFAFAASGLTDIAIPGSVIGIGQDAFASCYSLTNISVNATNPAYSSLNGVLFDKNQQLLIQYPTDVTNGIYTVPGSVATIADDAFYGASAVTSVTIPNSVGSIGNDAFAYCLALNAVYFAGNAPNIGSYAFAETDFGSGLTAYYIPGTTGWPAFSKALGQSLAALELWYLPSPEIINSGPSFGVHNGQFGFIISWATNATLVVSACSNISNPVWLPISTNTVAATNGAAVFNDPQWSSFATRFYRLQTASTPFAYATIDGAITISGYTGSGTAVTIPATINNYPVIGIGDNAFENDTSLSSITIPNSVTNIGTFAFAFSGLSGITIPRSVIGIGQDAFESCYGLAGISVNAANPAFSSVNGVLFDKAQDTLIQYPAGLTGGSYTVPSSVTTIGDDAFYFASDIGSVTIPSSVMSIGQDAFAYCYGLNTVYFGGNAPNVGSFAFYGTGFGGGVTVNYLPGTVGWQAFSAALGQSLAASESWYLPAPEILPAQSMESGKFEFTISWATNASVVVDACSNLVTRVWVPISTNPVTANTGTANFIDPQWRNYSMRFYRLRSP